MEAIWLIAWTGMAAAGPIGMAGAIGATRIRRRNEHADGLDTGYQFSAARPRHWLLFARDA